MKVIKDNYKKFPIQVTCDECESIIELEGIEDIHMNIPVNELGNVVYVIEKIE